LRRRAVGAHQQSASANESGLANFQTDFVEARRAELGCRGA